MSLHCLRQQALFRRQRTPFRWPATSSLALLSAVFFVLTGCADHSLGIDEAHTAHLFMAATFPEGASNQLGLVDAWRVQVIRPGEGVVAEDAGSLSPDQQTVAVELSVTLQASCEVLTVLIELSSNGEVWFRSEAPNEVCIGTENGIQVQELQWVGPVIGLNSTGLSFTLEEGEDPQTQILTVTNQGGGTLNWNASENQGWLDISPTSGSLGEGQSEAVAVTVTDIDLTGGQYQGLITVSDPNAINSPGTASVTLNYIQKPRIGLSAASLTFTTNEGVDSDPQTLTITNVGGGTLNWAAAENVGWLTVAPLSGSLGPNQSHELVVWVSPGALPGGSYQTTINIADPNAINSPRSVAVGLTVIPKPRIGLNPSSLSFAILEGQNPDAQPLTISNQGGQTLNWTASLDGGGWLGLSTHAGSLASGQSQNVTVSTSAGQLDPGVYADSIIVADPGAMNSPQVVPSGSPPRCSISSCRGGMTPSAGWSRFRMREEGSWNGRLPTMWLGFSSRRPQAFSAPLAELGWPSP